MMKKAQLPCTSYLRLAKIIKPQKGKPASGPKRKLLIQQFVKDGLNLKGKNQKRTDKEKLCITEKTTEISRGGSPHTISDNECSTPQQNEVSANKDKHVDTINFDCNPTLNFIFGHRLFHPSNTKKENSNIPPNVPIINLELDHPPPSHLSSVEDQVEVSEEEKQLSFLKKQLNERALEVFDKKQYCEEKVNEEILSAAVQENPDKRQKELPVPHTEEKKGGNKLEQAMGRITEYMDFLIQITETSLEVHKFLEKSQNPNPAISKINSNNFRSSLNKLKEIAISIPIQNIETDLTFLKSGLSKGYINSLVASTSFETPNAIISKKPKEKYSQQLDKIKTENVVLQKQMFALERAYFSESGSRNSQSQAQFSHAAEENPDYSSLFRTESAKASLIPSQEEIKGECECFSSHSSDKELILRKYFSKPELKPSEKYPILNPSSTSKTIVKPNSELNFACKTPAHLPKQNNLWKPASHILREHLPRILSTNLDKLFENWKLFQYRSSLSLKAISMLGSRNEGAQSLLNTIINSVKVLQKSIKTEAQKWLGEHKKDKKLIESLQGSKLPLLICKSKEELYQSIEQDIQMLLQTA